MTAHRLRHGEAVAIGIALDLAYSVAQGLPRPQATAKRVIRVLEHDRLPAVGRRARRAGARGGQTLIAGLREFREHLGGELHITLLRGIGSSFEVTEMDEDVVAVSIESLRHRWTPHCTQEAALPRRSGDR